MQDYSCPGATFAFCSHEEKLPQQGGLPGVVQRVTRLSKLPRGNENSCEQLQASDRAPAQKPLGPVHMIPGQLIAPGQLTDPRVSFEQLQASDHAPRQRPLGPVHMIPGQLIAPGNSLTPGSTLPQYTI